MLRCGLGRFGLFTKWLRLSCKIGASPGPRGARWRLCQRHLTRVLRFGGARSGLVRTHRDILCGLPCPAALESIAIGAWPLLFEVSCNHPARQPTSTNTAKMVKKRKNKYDCPPDPSRCALSSERFPVVLSIPRRPRSDCSPLHQRRLLTIFQRPQQEGPRPRQAHPLQQLLAMHAQGQGDQALHHPQHG